MRVEHYSSLQAFGADTLELLLQHEVQNNIPIGFIRNERGHNTSGWLLYTVKDAAGSVLLTAACTPPYNITLFETNNNPNDAALQLLANELKAAGVALPGVSAAQQTAQRFAGVYAGEGRYYTRETMLVMRLDKVNDLPAVPGALRLLREEDLFFAPYWQKEFQVDCRLPCGSLVENMEALQNSIQRCVHYIWEVDGKPVSQAANNRNTENGAVVSLVYTPPFYRGYGYATACVAELSRRLLAQGHQFCCLYADASNPVSCGIYRKIGYAEQCTVAEIKFGNP